MHIYSRTPYFAWVLVLAALTLCSLAAAPVCADDLLTLLDGQQVTGEVQTIARDGSILGDNLPADLTLERLLELQREGEIRPRAFRGVEAYLISSGGILSGDSVTLADDICTLGGTVAGEVKVKVERLGSLLLIEGPPAEVFTLAQATPLRLSDVVFLNTDTGPRAIESLVEAITPVAVTINWEGDVREVPRERIYGIVFADHQETRSNSRCLLRFTSGEELTGVILELRDGELSLQTSFSPGLVLPFEKIACIEVFSTRHIYLSDLDPINVSESTMLSLASPWQRNLSVGGRPLRLGNRQYAHGFGVHATSRLTFTVERNFETFSAIVGLDDETESHGDCEIVIYTDDQEIFRERVQGGEPPITIRLNIGSPRRITLAVEAGEGYDLADHVSWCDVRLLNLEDD